MCYSILNKSVIRGNLNEYSYCFSLILLKIISLISEKFGTITIPSIIFNFSMFSNSISLIFSTRGDPSGLDVVIGSKS